MKKVCLIALIVMAFAAPAAWAQGGAKQGPQGVSLTAADVRQLVGQHANHGFVRSQAR